MQPEVNQEKRPRLLIVDDESANLQLMSHVFRQRCEIDTATNGRDALELLVANKYDTVLLDIMMPIMSGLDVLKIIRNSRDISELPVILISAIADRPQVTRGFRLGANDYISKPLNIDVIQARVTTQIMMKQLMDERRHMIGQLQETNEMKARMMQVASHDLKNPLNNLKMLMTLMRKQVTEPEKVMKLIGMVDHSLDAMLNVIQDFLDNAFVSTSDLELDLQPLNSMELVQQILNQYEIAALNKEIDIITENVEGIILADTNRLHQVLSNLVSNAIKYSPPGTTVTLKGEQTDGTWRLNIIDQGPGIPENEQQHLFQPFSKDQISTQPTAGESSTGLGLWIAKQMVELQRGRVGAECPPEGGSIFWVELPLVSETAKS